MKERLAPRTIIPPGPHEGPLLVRVHPRDRLAFTLVKTIPPADGAAPPRLNAAGPLSHPLPGSGNRQPLSGFSSSLLALTLPRSCRSCGSRRIGPWAAVDISGKPGPGSTTDKEET